MKLRVSLMCGLLLNSPFANAQDLGQQNMRQQQWQQEQNRLGYQAQQDAYAAQQSEMLPPPPPPQPTGEWIKTWGAIADATNGMGGVAVGQLSKTSAEKEAVNQCAQAGGVNCKPSFAYFNQCIAIVTALSGPPNGVMQSAGSIEKAKNLAFPECMKKNNNAACEVVYSACSEPFFKHY